MRPKSLAEVARWTLEGENFSFSLRNFLDDFYREPAAEALAEEPARLAGTENGDVRDAYLAAVGEELARKYNLPHPKWIWAEDRKLRWPWFGSEMQSLRAVLIHESPPGFRSRNLFVSENALSRA